MAIFLTENSKVVVQGMTGSEGQKHTRRMIASGHQRRRRREPEEGRPERRLRRQRRPGLRLRRRGDGRDRRRRVGGLRPAGRHQGRRRSRPSTPAMPLVVVITEGVPVHDTADFFSYAQAKGTTRIIGPNCPGLISPGKSNAGIIPADITKAGRVGLVSKSGTLTYQMMYELRDFGFTTAVGIGGDPIIGTTHIDCLQAFEDDPDTDAIVMIGEIGGDAEERAAAYIKDHVTKPVVGYVAGFTAPEGKTMGHAGAIVSGSSGTAAGQAGGPRGRRRQGRQDAVRDRPADARHPQGPLTPLRRPSASRPRRGVPSCDGTPAVGRRTRRLGGLWPQDATPRRGGSDLLGDQQAVADGQQHRAAATRARGRWCRGRGSRPSRGPAARGPRPGRATARCRRPRCRRA